MRRLGAQVTAVPGSPEALLVICASGAALLHVSRTGASSASAPLRPTEAASASAAAALPGRAPSPPPADADMVVDSRGGADDDDGAAAMSGGGDKVPEESGCTMSVSMSARDAGGHGAAAEGGPTEEMADGERGGGVGAAEADGGDGDGDDDVAMASDDSPTLLELHAVSAFAALPSPPAAVAWCPQPGAGAAAAQQQQRHRSAARLYIATFSQPDDLLALDVSAETSSLAVARIRAAESTSGGDAGDAGCDGSSWPAPSGRDERRSFAEAAAIHPAPPAPPPGGAAAAAALVGLRQALRGVASALGCLPGSQLAVFRAHGDGVVLQITEQTPESPGAPASLAAAALGEPVLNCAPLLCAARGGGGAVVAATAGRDGGGALRVLSRGLNAPTLLVTPPTFPAATGVWALSPDSPSAAAGGAAAPEPAPTPAAGVPHSLLVLSFVSGTRALALGADDWEDVSESSGLDTDESTLAAGVVWADGCPVPLIAQVLTDGVRFAAYPSADTPTSDAGATQTPPLAFWRPPPPPAGLTSPGRGAGQGEVITVAAVCPQGVLVALAHARTLVLLRPITSAAHRGAAPPGSLLPGIAVMEVASFQPHAEISCLGVDGETWDGEPVCVAGTHRPSVEVLSLAPGRELRHVATCPLGPGGSAGEADSTGAVAGASGGWVPESCFATAWGGAATAAAASASAHAQDEGGLAWGRAGAAGQAPPPAQAQKRLFGSDASPSYGAAAGGRRPLILVGMRAGDLLEIPCDDAASAPAAEAPFRQTSPTGVPILQRLAPPGSPQPGTPGPSAQQQQQQPAVLSVRRARKLGESAARIVALGQGGRGPVAVLSDRPWLFQATPGLQGLAGAPVAAPHARHGVALRVPGSPPGVLLVENERLRRERDAPGVSLFTVHL